MRRAADRIQRARLELPPEQLAVRELPSSPVCAERLVRWMGRHQPVRLPERVVMEAAPWILPGVLHQARPNGVHLDVAAADEEVALRVDHAGPISTFPQRPG